MTPPAASVSIDKTLVLVGLMGAGKTTVGRRLASALKRAFRDADEEIEKAAGRSVAEIFEDFGEAAFRDGERKVIARLITQERSHVLALGGGAFMDAHTRALIKANALSVWLDVDVETLIKRVSQRDTRPLLRGRDPRTVMVDLHERRAPVYAQADIRVRLAAGRHQEAVDAILEAVAGHLAESPAS